MQNPELKEVIWCKEQGNQSLPSYKELFCETPDPEKLMILSYLQAGDLHDDRYYWHSDLIHCIAEHNVSIPEEFREHIIKHHKRRNHRFLALRLIKKIVIDIYLLNSTHYHIELDENGDILHRTPNSQAPICKNHPDISFRYAFLEPAKELLLYDTGLCSAKEKTGFHWSVAFYHAKGLYLKTEGGPQENQWRHEIFCTLLSQIEQLVGEQLGSKYLTLCRANTSPAEKAASNHPAIPLQDTDCRSLAEIADKLLCGAARKTAKGNVLICPVSIAIVLAILSRAANGRSLEQLQSFSGLDATDFWKIAAILHIGIVLEKSNVALANGLFIEEFLNTYVKKDFTEALQTDLAAVLFHSADPVNEINAWAKEKTHGMISPMIRDRSSLGDITLLSAAAFAAKWRQHYDAWDIEDGIFQNIHRQAENVTMLHSTEKHFIFDESAVGFIKPYKNCDFSFMALLPRLAHDPLELVRSMEPGKIRELYKSAFAAEVAVTMPEFGFDVTVSVRDILSAYGVTAIFAPDRADITNLISSEHSHISEIVQKTHITVDRCGTRAAAATMTFALGGCAPEMEKFEVVLDHPFVFAIIHNQSGLPLFQGIVNTINEPI